MQEFFKPGTLFFNQKSPKYPGQDTLLLLWPAYTYEKNATYVFLNGDGNLQRGTPICWHQSWCFITPDGYIKSILEYHDAYNSIEFSTKIML